MNIIIYSSVDAPIVDVAGDLSAGGVVVYAVATSRETPPINIGLGDELRKTNAQGPDVAHLKVQVGDNDWFDCYTCGNVGGFDFDTAPELVGKALKLWQADGERWRYGVELQGS